MRRGEISYARVGEHHIAYREYVGDGDGDQEIVMVNGANFPMESLLDDPVGTRLVEGLAGLGRLVVLDRRGVALSDPVTDWDTPIREQWADDLAAVIVASGCDRPTVFSWESSAVARDCSIRHPELVGRLVLFNPRPSFTEADAELRERMAEGLARIRSGRSPGEGDPSNPMRGADPTYMAWMDAAGRAGASPRLAAQMQQKRMDDPPFDDRQVRVPTLVITRTPQLLAPDSFTRRPAREIPNAQHVELGHGDFFAVGAGVDDLLAEISRYLTGSVILPAPERQLAVVMFTDLVDSTRRARSAGDGGWKQLLDRHDDLCGREVDRRGGEVVKTTGDGILALLPSATAAIEAARAIRADLAGDDLAVRVGIHIGEIDRRGADVSGIAVHTAARIMAAAAAGQILTSRLVTETTDAAAFTSVGPAELKGLDATWELFDAG